MPDLGSGNQTLSFILWIIHDQGDLLQEAYNFADTSQAEVENSRSEQGVCLVLHMCRGLCLQRVI